MTESVTVIRLKAVVETWGRLAYWWHTEGRHRYGRDSS